MTFTWLNKQGVQSDEGFSLQSVGRFEWEYREGAKMIALTGEATSSGGKQGFAFAKDWVPQTSADQRRRIVDNIVEAMKFMDLEAEFDQ